jgi:hypothetical protein
VWLSPIGANGKAASDTESYTVGRADRIRAGVDLATRYSVLRRKPNVEKRLALVLTNFANRHGQPEFFGGTSVYSGLQFESPRTAYTGDGSVSREYFESGFRTPGAVFTGGMGLRF